MRGATKTFYFRFLIYFIRSDFTPKNVKYFVKVLSLYKVCKWVSEWNQQTCLVNNHSFFFLDARYYFRLIFFLSLVGLPYFFLSCPFIQCLSSLCRQFNVFSIEVHLCAPLKRWGFFLLHLSLVFWEKKKEKSTNCTK